MYEHDPSEVKIGVKQQFFALVLQIFVVHNSDILEDCAVD
jgi:hypothetical protein